jgi:hypothetical protein
MVFFQGEWYCVQCGASHPRYEDNCRLCQNDEFQKQPYAPIDDLDQLGRDNEKLFEYDCGNF